MCKKHCFCHNCLSAQLIPAMISSQSSVTLSLILLLQCASALMNGSERQFGVRPNDSAASVVFLRHGESLFNQVAVDWITRCQRTFRTYDHCLPLCNRSIDLLVGLILRYTHACLFRCLHVLYIPGPPEGVAISTFACPWFSHSIPDCHYHITAHGTR